MGGKNLYFHLVTHLADFLIIFLVHNPDVCS